jgi:cyclic pyranopterin phosphate synthase
MKRNSCYLTFLLTGQISEFNLKSIGITTNGILLARLLPELIASGVTSLNVSLDTLIPKKFEKISRRPASAWFNVWKGIEMAELNGYHPLKINCVVQGGINDDEICDFVELTKDRHLDVRFIEYMPFSGNKWDLSRMVAYKDMVDTIKTRYPDFKKLEDSVNHTSKVMFLNNKKFRQIIFFASTGLQNSRTCWSSWFYYIHV